MSACTFKSDKSIAPYLVILSKIMPEHFDLYNHLGNIYKNLGNYQEAIQYFRRAEQIAPEKLDYLKIGECFSYLNQYEPAIQYYQLAEAQHADNEQLYRLWGFACRETGAYQNCIDNYLKADKIKPNQTWYLGNVGWCYQKIDNYSEGLKYHQRCEELNPNEVWNLDNIGYCYQRLKNYDSAIEYYQKSLFFQSKNDWAMTQLGWCYIVLGDFYTSRGYFEQVITANGAMSQYALMNAGHCFLATGEPSKAFRFYKKSVVKYEKTEDFAHEFEDDFEYVGISGAVSANDYQLIKKELRHYRERYLKKYKS
jgi:Flp pilus assembly protein TadD